MSKKNNLSQHGFTLVELAIVIVIIGLLVGGVLQGQELIKQAKIRSLVSQLKGYDAAINIFRSKYGTNAMPGDFIRASQFGLNAVNGVVNTSLTPQANNNGNGDELLDDGTKLSSVSAVGEILNFWVHLSNAKLIKGALTQPANCNGTCNYVAGTGFPSAPLGNGIYVLSISVDPDPSMRLTYILGISGTVASSGMGDVVGGDANSILSRTLASDEAYGIDSKVDDGNAYTGISQSIDRKQEGNGAANESKGTATNCETATGVYNLAYTKQACTITMRAAW